MTIFLKDCLLADVEYYNSGLFHEQTIQSLCEEKGDKMSALPATVIGLSVDVPVGTVRRALAVVQLPGSDTVAITISLKRLVSLAWRVWWDNSLMKFLVERRCRPMWNLVLDLGIGVICFGCTPCEPRMR